MAFADDYVSVNERIAAFVDRYPEGSLQSEITHLTDTLVVVKAWAYRDRLDERPGIGHSSLGIPGKTNFTRDAEVENAETSAWGRAIAALGFEVKKGVATRNEIENKPAPDPWADGAHKFVDTAIERLHITEDQVFRALNVDDGDALIAYAKRTEGGWNTLAGNLKEAVEAMPF